MENKLLELTKRRRSIRRYKQGHIDKDIISEILKVAHTAPTAFGNRTVFYAVVSNKELIKQIGACKSYGGSQINGADTVIVVMAKKNQEFWIEDATIASTCIILACEEFDIGACWVQIRNRNGQFKTSDAEIRELLNISNEYEVSNLVALGFKGEKKTPYSDNFDFSDVKFYA